MVSLKNIKGKCDSFFNLKRILGLVKESRDAICADAEGNLQSNESLCDETRLPELSQACEEEQTQEVN